jgi:hypothetical protein
MKETIIYHEPMFDTEKIEKMYSEKDGVPVKYVMTSELPNIDKPMDIFYRDTPHPDFGNRYFGIFSANGGSTYITNADAIEGCLGYVRYSGETFTFKVINGNLVEEE